MKRLILLNILLAALSAPAHAATIQAFATMKASNPDSVPPYSPTDGYFSATAGGTTALSDTEIQAIIASDASAAIYGFSANTYSIIDLDFGDTIVKTGTGGDSSGADLAVFSLWNGYDYKFGLQVFDTAGIMRSDYRYDVKSATLDTCYTDGSCPSGVKTTSINLYDNKTGKPLDDNIEIGYISLFIGGKDLNGPAGDFAAYSNFSLVGAYYPEAAVVPLPLPAILFSSGLLLLGWVGRRKTV